MNKYRELLLCVPVLLFSNAENARAQLTTLDLPPPVQFIDNNGVDLRSGQFSERIGELKIGPEGADQIAHSFGISSFGAYSGTPITGEATHSICVPETLDYGPCVMAANDYTVGPVTYGAGGISKGFTAVQITGGYLLTDRSGAKYFYDKNYGDNPPDANGYQWIYARISKIIYPNGYEINYHYHKTPVSAGVDFIFSNTGLFSHLIFLRNMAFIHCNTEAGSCDATNYPWPSITGGLYSYGLPYSITDPRGKIWTGTKVASGSGASRVTTDTRNDPIGNQVVVRSSIQGRCGLPYNYPGRLVTTSVTRRGISSTYSYVIDCSGIINQATRTNPDGTTYKIIRDTINRYKYIVTDEKNRPTIYEFSHGLGPIGSSAIYDGDIESITDPEGDRYEYAYDSRGNVTTTTFLDKLGGVHVIRSAIFPETCTNPVTCNQPKSVTDARGATTSYEYDPIHGGVARVTSPEVGGVAPVKRYGYFQRYAWLKDAAGATFSKAATPIWLLSEERTCQATATVGNACAGGSGDEIVTQYEYGPDDSSHGNNLWLRGKAVTAKDSDGVIRSYRTCYGYDPLGNKIWETSPRAGLTVCA